MSANASMEDFEALLNESYELVTPDEGSVVKGLVLAIEAGQAIIDIGYKMEGRVELKEFAKPGHDAEITVGDTVEVFLERCLLYTSPSPRDQRGSRMPSSA